MQDEYIYIAFFDNKDIRDIISHLIKFFTRSNLNHTAAYLPEQNVLIEPIKGKLFGITRWKYSNFSNHRNCKVYIFRLKVSKTQKNLFEKFMRFLADTNTMYNYLGVIGFVIPIFTSNGGYFCSEGVYAALQFAGITSIETKAWQYNPDEVRELLENMHAELYKVLYIDKQGVIHEISIE